MDNNSSFSDIKIVHWNAYGLINKMHELPTFLQTYNIDVLLVGETWFTDDIKPKPPFGYKCYRKNRKNSKKASGGIAIFIKNNIPCYEVNINNLQSAEAHGIKLENNILIISLYVPKKLIKSDLDIIFNLNSKIIAAGDYNAKHKSWNCFRNNANGTTLFNYVERKTLTIEAPNDFTLFPFNSKAKPSIVDLTLLKNITNHNTTQVLNELDSDHKPVLFSLKNERSPRNENKRSFLNYKLANWKIFKSEINDTLNINSKIDSITDIDDSVEQLTNILNNSIIKAIPKAKPFRIKIKLPQQIINQIKERNKLRLIYQKTRNKYLKPLLNESSAKIKMSIKNHKNLMWEDKLHNLNIKDCSLWKMTKALKGKNNSHIPPLQDNDKIIFKDEEKAELIANNFEKVHTLTSDFGDSKFDEEINLKYLNIIKSETKLENIKLASPKEIMTIIRKTKGKKAPGLDGIQNIVLKHLPKKALVQLNYIINACLRQSYFPKAWKTAKILPIPKPGKDHKRYENYRPISLLPTLSKVLESIILNRLKEHETIYKQIISEQFGFRAKHNTVQQLARLTDFITTNFNLNKSVGALFLDMEKAFDTVWHKGLISKLEDLDIDIYLLKIIASYLENRKFIVDINGKTSCDKNAVAGVPQGSVLGPILFLYFINDLPLSDKVKKAIFADDTALYTSSWRKKQIAKNLQQYILIIEKYYLKWKLKINVDKTEFIIFSHKLKDKHIPKLTLYNENVPLKEKVKYLGMILDNKLKFKNHITEVRQKTFQIIGQMYPLLCCKSKMNTKNKKTIYKMIIRPTMLYAAPIWGGTFKSYIQRLQILQNKCLRMILCAKRGTKISKLHKQSEILSIKKFIYKATKDFYDNFDKLEILKDICNIKYKEAPFKIKHRLPNHLLQFPIAP